MHIYWTEKLAGFVSSARTPPPILEEERLHSEWRATGHFWLPEAPTVKLWGQIESLLGRGIFLVLEGSFWDRGEVGRGLDCDALHGALFNGAPCTLFETFCNVESFVGETYVDRAHFWARFALLGDHFDGLDDRRLRHLSLEFSHLDSWFGDPYRITLKKTDLDKALVSFVPSGFTSEAEFEGVPFTLFPFCTRTIPSGSASGKLQWTYRYTLIIRPNEPQSLKWFFNVATLTRKLFVFLIGTGISTLRVSGGLVKEYGETERRIPTKAEVFTAVDVPLLIRTSVRDYCTHYKDVSSSMPMIVRNWFRKHDELRVVCAAYSGVLLDDGAEREGKFLRIVQVLEHFHGLLFPDSRRYMARSQWRQLRALLEERLPNPLPLAEGGEEQLPENLRAILLERIGPLNRLSFRSRLEELCRRMPLRALFPILDNPPPDWEPSLADFLASVEATRHYLTHFEEELRPLALLDQDLERATARCWAILTYWLADSLEFNKESARRIAVNAKNAMFLVAGAHEL